MNKDKAYDFFSAYQEGVLDPGLRQAFEQKLASDPQVAEEYRRFELTLREVDEVFRSPVETPRDLHERILSRIDRHLYEQKRKRPVLGLAGIWRNLAFGTLAAAALIGGIYGLMTRAGGPARAGVVGQSGTTSLQFHASLSSMFVEINAAREETLTVRSIDGQVLNEVRIPAGEWRRTPLLNRQETAAVLSVEIEGDKLSHIVGLPGRVQTSLQTGSGNLAEFARALAGWYRSPVLVEVAQPTQPVRWNFTQSGPTEAASAALQDMPFTVESRDPNLVRIADR